MISCFHGIQISSQPGLLVQIPYRLVPQYRRRVLIRELEGRLKAIRREVAEERQTESVELEVMPHHVHLRVEVDPQFGIHRLIRLMNGRSSPHLRQEFLWLKRLPTLWTHASCVFTVGGAPLAVIKPYIENQKNV